MNHLTSQIEEAVASVDFGTASARKRGRNPDYPYVPVIERPNGTTSNPVRGRAYATRTEAVAAAQRQIDGRRRQLSDQLAQPRYRALREAYGLPRELD